MPLYVLDTSALLAYLNDEPGGDEVEALLDDALISTVNLAEVLQKATRNDISATQLTTDIAGMGVHSVAFDASMAAMTAQLWPQTKTHGLSLADRGCLSLAAQFNAIAVTADRAWADLDLPGIDIHLVKR
ncbi:MAG TPA: type II toxin-antitoxin system VapC family toxin [Lacisediminihabitans sp.]|jgi:PIN domain nuclease of toxin-antitoxin system|nr:type II toxin-antitoxin system VapC family toxin [Lacisediminihabitans sp.]HXD61682.1 type II toxin-antitoxin system VapC family toxin [Lacisediminihabitans sp.]